MLLTHTHARTHTHTHTQYCKVHSGAVEVGRKHIYTLGVCGVKLTGHQVMVRPAKKYPPTVERLVRNMDWKHKKHVKIYVFHFFLLTIE